MTDSAFMFLLLKSPPRLNTAQVCRRPGFVDRGPGELPGPCTRPIWCDGIVDGKRYDLCSKCWHEYAAIYGPYRLMQANAAAEAPTDAALERLYVTRRLGAACGCGRSADDQLLCSKMETCPMRPPEAPEPDEDRYA